MISLKADTKIFLAVGATDMRKGFDGLCGLVSGTLEMDPLSGHLFLFINRRRVSVLGTAGGLGLAFAATLAAELLRALTLLATDRVYRPYSPRILHQPTIWE